EVGIKEDAVEPAGSQGVDVVDDVGLHHLAAYVVLDSATADVVPAELRAFLRERLPGHLVPATVSVLKALPLTANGKVDRAHLPVPVPEAADGDRPPTSPTEVALSRIWAEVLALDLADISCGHNFFELGGHSLLLTSVASRIRDQLRAELPLRVMFDTPTLAELASAVDSCEEVSTPRIMRTDRAAHRATVSVHGHLKLPGALRERLRALP
ncbi:MAG: phosphopantetheine-binding protein, partial [Actinobacteria bacterium]|nr:phosphopantetheine-binding protein [Actinomycetota bacterium]